MLKTVINKKYKDPIKKFVSRLPQIFHNTGETIYKSRNIIKVFDFEGLEINVKSFKVPHLINQLVYAKFRESKAERSYRYAHLLDERGINTPTPLAYIEEKKGILLKKSAFISIHEHVDGEIRVLYNGTLAEHKELIKQFAHFTARLHGKGVLHLDFSSGNILYKIDGDKYIFYLVDLNRMKFDTNVTLPVACHNFRRLWGNDEIIAYFAKEYAKARGFDEQETIDATFKYRVKFWKTFRRKYPDASSYEGEVISK